MYHKRLDKIDGNALYVRDLIDSLSKEYNVVLPSEYFFRSNLRVSGNWLVRTLEVNLFSILWFIKNIRRLKDEVGFIVMEDRYSLISAFFVRKMKAKLLARISDWGIEYTESLPFKSKIMGSFFLLFGRIYEQFIYRSANAIIVPSDYVGSRIEAVVRLPTLVFPVTFNRDLVARSKKGSSDGPKLSREVNCIFVGNYEYKPNELAARFITEQLAGEVYLRDENIKFIIAGPGGTEKLGRTKRKNVEIHGLVGDLHTLYARCDIGLNPSETVGGTSVKIIEYLSQGLFVLSTPQGSVGIIKSSRVVVTERKNFRDSLLKLAERIRSEEVKEDSDESKRISDYYSRSKNTEKLLDFLRSLEAR